jgi:hypothetical protein
MIDVGRREGRNASHVMTFTVYHAELDRMMVPLGQSRPMVMAGVLESSLRRARL